MKVEQLQAYDETIGSRVKTLTDAHQTLYGPARDLTVAYAPGRAEILGNHTDYNEGYTLSANVTSNLLIAASARDDRIVRIKSQDVEGPVVEFDASSIGTLESAKSEAGSSDSWSNYVKGVLSAYIKVGHNPRGFDAVLESTIPSGGGLSSSAALETAVSRLVNHFNGLDVNEVEQVGLCKQAENDYVGAPCGYLDQATVGLSEDWLLMSYKSEGGQPFVYQPVSADLTISDQRLVVGYDPASKHALVDGKYALRQEACYSSLPAFEQLLGRDVAALRDVSIAELESHRPELVKRLGQRAVNFVTHVVYENTRVGHAVNALHAQDFERFGTLMTESGRSALDLYELDEEAPELRFVYDTVSQNLADYGALGIRNMGGGFNATTLALVDNPSLGMYKATLKAAYQKKFGRPYNLLSFVPAPAASIVETV